MTPAISIIISAYNYGQYLGEALASVLGQTFGDFELIVVDDGSTDNTPDVVRRFLSDPRVRSYRQAHRGQSSAKNLGLRVSRASILAFVDADDIWLPTKLAKQMAIFHADPGVDVVYTRRSLIDPRGAPVEYHEPPQHRGRILEPLFQGNFICFSSSLVRRHVFERVGGFDERLPLAVDWDLWLRVAIAHRFDYIDEPLVKYRIGHVNLSSRVGERLSIVHRLMDRFLDERGGRGLLKPEVVRRAYAETCYHTALYRRNQCRSEAFVWYLRSLGYKPTYWLAWQGLASLPLPESGRRILRRLLGKPVDWSQRVSLEVLAMAR